ncbi:50S ribosomal protein L6 [Candidatus Roizmanbacteria bacterium]|nr:50S ribosomal protein L6 [Candidatus Roizmanbacteria bacterium]
MSKIGEKLIPVPDSVHVAIQGNTLRVTGKHGVLSISVPVVLDIHREENSISVKRKTENKSTKSLHGLYRSLIANAVQGVEEPWKKKLEIVGTGYNVKLEGENLVFKVGYSHPVVFKRIAGTIYQVEGNNKVIVSGVDKQLVGQTAYQIKLIRKPDAYKGKGIRFEGERLRIKPGKKAKTTA